MPQMYKVFNNSQKIILANKDEFSSLNGKNFINISDFSKMHNIIDNQIFSNNKQEVILLSKDSNKLIDFFESEFNVRLAGGGWVFDKKSKLLMIKRNKIWDIPKGHLEKGETIEECSIREVEEETGIKNLKIESYLGISRHLFVEKDLWILKVCHWYKMISNFEGELVPQIKEGITKSRWIKGHKVENKLKKGWPSLFHFYEENILKNQINEF